MHFCTTCGRQRAGTSPFCAGCGAEFSDAPDPTPQVAETSEQQAPAAETAPQSAPTAEAAAAEPAPDAEPDVQAAADEETTAERGQPAEDVTDAAPPAAADWGSPASEQPDIAGHGSGETRADMLTALPDQPGQSESSGDLTRWDTYWYRQDPAPVPQSDIQPAEAWPSVTPPVQPAEAPPAGPTAYGPPSYGPGSYGPGSTGQAGYGPESYAQGSPGQGSYGQAPYQPPPHVSGAADGPPLRRGQTGVLIAVLIVVLLAVGGGAYALVSRYTSHKTAASPSGQPTQSAPSSAPTTPSGSTPSASPTASPTASSSNGVIVQPGAASNPAEPGVVAFVNRYFTAINSHDYAAYNSLLVPKLQAINTRSDFETGYGTTTDSAQTLTSLTATSSGGEAATLTFTSNQSPAESPTKTSCTHWTITLYLEPNGGSYLIASAPSGYHAAYQAC